MSPFAYSAGTTTPHRLRKKSTSPKQPSTRPSQPPEPSRPTTPSTKGERTVPVTPSRIPRPQSRASNHTTPVHERRDPTTPIKKLSIRVKTPYPGPRTKRPSTAPTPSLRTPSSCSNSSDSSSSTSSDSGPKTPTTPGLLPGAGGMKGSTSLPALDMLDPETLEQLELLSLELLSLTASDAHTPPRKKSVLRRSPRLGNIVEVDTPQGGTPVGCGLQVKDVSMKDVLREVGRLGRELSELA